MLKKISLFFIILSFICCFNFTLFKNYSSSNDKTIDCISNDETGPIIKIFSPLKCQQYIVAKPSIKVNFSDKSGIDKSSINLYVNYKNVTDKCLITNDFISYTPLEKFKRGNQIIRLEVGDLSPDKNKSIIEWYFTVGTPIYNHYHGLLHSHTSASDGKGTYNDAYYLARDEANLDFFAISEHSNMLDNFLLCNINDGSKSSEWNELIKCRDKFTLDNKFIALSGFEMTYPYSLQNPIGHINIFNSNGFVAVEQEDIDLKNFYMLMYEQNDLIGQFNHPCDKFGKFNQFEYSYYGDMVMSLLEVGNGYNKDMSKNIKAYDMYQLALDKGWHVAPTCNQDNHRVNFGIANEFRTVILSTNLTRDAIYDALKNMRVYATEDKNIKIDYTVNDLPMGSIIDETSKLNFSVTIVDNDDNDKIEEVQVISNNNKIIYKKKFNSNLAKLEFTLKPTKNTFYYVKIIQNNNKYSVTAPIWINGK
ncbi:CehA/McbA family metallohydrolase [Romboutsia sp.]|uniref:CehA/McbA family metallohydrolase n=1 Tax=Romboutsia sp. TaxID=1965302 RepID=UPI003F318812